MNNANDSPDDEEQLATPINDYRALLEMTRALVIAEDTGPSLQVPIQGNEATSPETEAVSYTHLTLPTNREV